jgi:signal transduction histidine kinase
VNLAQLAVAIALFNYGLRRPRGRTIQATAVTAVTLGAVSVLAVVLGAADWGRQDVVLWLCTAAAVAVAMQSRRAAFAALEDRARRAEETREETARRRVAEDRVRIARELHDVIAHHVAVISVQAGVAAHVVEQNPAAARDALGTVRSSAKTVLAELQSVLGVLRQDESALPTTPAPGLSRLADLVDSFASTGTPARLDAPDPVPQLPPAADVAAYRLVQEALTNVHKHAAGAAATVLVRSRTDTVELVVTNGPPPDQAPPADANRGVPDGAASTGSGLGLVGMRERVLAAGGALETGPTADGGFRVAARMPLHEGTR